jgi:L-lactate dehydrogenase complex protein LldF
MQSKSPEFRTNAVRALHDPQLQAALGIAQEGSVGRRATVVDGVREFEQIRCEGEAIKNHTLAHLDYYLERYEAEVIKRGGQVHWAENSADARRIVLDICRSNQAKLVVKGKSMVSEEVAINEVLQEAGIQVVETDLGEYILQLAGQPPSHIITPAIHLTREQVSDLFLDHHAPLGFAERKTGVPELVNEARKVLRQYFLTADVGITGANFLIAETGANVIVTNEGNGDLSCTLPKVHIVTAGIEKVVPSLDDAGVLLRLLARSATGQDFTSYTTFSAGPRRPSDLDGPEQYHVILIDNGRSDMVGGKYHQMLRCIRCGACMNHCPVYGAVGGHAYGWVYPGPMGSVLTPLLTGLDTAYDLPNACTLNGRCQTVCPVRIPLTDLLRQHRVEQHTNAVTPFTYRMAIKLWASVARRPRVYQQLTRLSAIFLKALAGSSGRLSKFPGAGSWTATRDLPAPPGKTFQQLWKRRRQSAGRRSE